MRIMPAARRASALFVLVVTFLTGTPAPVSACVPAPTPAPGATRPPATATPTIAQAAAQAEVVFRGRPIRREDVSYKFIDMPTIRTTFAIDTLWKGPPTAQVTILTFSCGGDADPFRAPGSYIVYASKGPNGELVPLDGVSRLASASEPEDAVLGPGLPVPALAPGTPAFTPTVTPPASVPVVTPALVTPVPPPLPTSTATTAPTTGSSAPVAATTPVASSTAGTSTGSAGEVALSGPGSRVPILLIGGALAVAGGLTVVARVRRRTRPGKM